MIGGLVAMTLDRSILRQLGTGRRAVVVTGTNGKSTTTRMTAAALATLGPVASNSEGANMDAGLVAALAADRARRAGRSGSRRDARAARLGRNGSRASSCCSTCRATSWTGSARSTSSSARCAAGLARHPKAVVVANCDDVLMTSAAYDSPNVVWVAAGGAWANDSVSCPRSGEVIVRDKGHWYSTGADFKRPSPHWWFDPEDGGNLYGPDGLALPMRLALPGAVNRGNAAQAVAAAVALGADPAKAVAAVSGRRRSRRALPDRADRPARGADPAGQEPGRLAGGAVDGGQARRRGRHRGQRAGARRRGPVLAVGRALRALREDTPVVAAGERGTDLAVRLGYAGVEHTLVHDTMAAIASCPPGRVEVVANYTAFLQLQRKLARHG